jgi:thiamine monophosphate synthase
MPLPGGSWSEWEQAAADDKPIHPFVDLIKTRMKHQKLVICTARSENCQSITMSWLLKHGIYADAVLMRPKNNFDTSPVLKLKMVENFLGPDWKEKVAFVIDDRDDVLQAFRAHGVHTLQAFY